MAKKIRPGDVLITQRKRNVKLRNPSRKHAIGAEQRRKLQLIIEWQMASDEKKVKDKNMSGNSETGYRKREPGKE